MSIINLFKKELSDEIKPKKKTLKQSQRAGIVGIIILLLHFIMSIYYDFRNNMQFGFIEAVLPEMINSIIFPIITLWPPAIILVLIKDFKKIRSWVFWLYPIILFLGLLHVYLADDPLAAGLPVLLLVIPFCLIFTIVLLFLRQKQ